MWCACTAYQAAPARPGRNPAERAGPRLPCWCTLGRAAFGDAMTVNMDWRDAMAVRCIALAFSQDGRGMGWPDAMEPQQLALMQRPYAYDDSQGKRSAAALRDALLEACKGQVIACESETRNVMVSAARDMTPGRFVTNWPDAYTRDGVAYAYTRPAVYEDRTSYRVAAADFAAWLAAQGIEPSRHIAAWLKVQAAALPGAMVSESAAPAIEAQDVTDWLSLVRYRQQFASVAAQKRPVWLLSHVDLLADHLRQVCAAGQGRGALGRLGEELGATRQALAGLLEKQQYSKTTGEKVQPVATPFTGMGARRAA